MFSKNEKVWSIARNTGAKNAAYNIIAYTDDDVKIRRNLDKKYSRMF